MKVRFDHPALVELDESIDTSNIIIEEYKTAYGYKDYRGYMIVQGKMEVCPTCGGRGTHFRSDLDENELIDLYREDGDYEGLESYYAGAFDQTCEQCKGQNVIAAPDWDCIPKEIIDACDQWDECEAESNWIQAQEQAMGA